MNFFLFTYPNCEKCQRLKKYLQEVNFVPYQEFNLVQKESKLKIREFLRVIKRDEKGAIPIPLLVVEETGGRQIALHNEEEVRSWWKSRG